MTGPEGGGTHSASTTGGPEGESGAMGQAVLARLDVLSRQMEEMAAGQKVIEAVVNKIDQRLLLTKEEPPATSPVPWFGVTDGCLSQPSSSRSAAPWERAATPAMTPAGRATTSSMQPGERAATSASIGESFDPSELRPRMEQPSKGTTSRVMNVPSTSATSSNLGLVVQTRRRCIPIHPDSRTRAICDIIVMLVLFYESLMIPYDIAFDLEYRGVWRFLSWCTLAIWVLDLILGFSTGYHKKDEVVMDWKPIAKRYVATTFFPNLLVVIADIVGNILQMISEDFEQSAILIKLMRFIKFNRVLRISTMINTGKVAQFYDILVIKMRRLGLHEQFTFATQVVKILFYLVWLNHLGSCIWHLIGTEGTAAWYAELKEGSDTAPQKFDTRPLGYQYLVGFHWNAQTMIAGESFMSAENPGEHVWTIIVAIGGFIISNIFISSLLTTVMEYQMSNRERHTKMKTLRQFLYQHDVDSRLLMPIEKQVNDRITSSKRLSEQDVAALSLLSPTMRADLSYNIYGPSLQGSTFIRACNELDTSFVKDICFSALRHEPHEPGKRIFEPHKEAAGAHFIYWGKMEYHPQLRSSRSRAGTMSRFKSQATNFKSMGSLSSEEEVGLMDTNNSQTQSKLSHGTWVSEVALFAHWQHRGWLEATTPCEVLIIEAGAFMKVVAGNPDLHQLHLHYSTSLVSALKREPHGTFNDLQLNVAHESVVSAMPVESRVLMSSAAIRVLERRNQWAGRMFQQNGMQELRDEIAAGDCDLLLDTSERVLRVVTIVAVRLEREDGAILTQIGKCIKGQTMASCTLPGTKIRIGEHPQDAVARLLKQKLQAISSGVTLGSRSVDCEERVSKKLGLHSRYSRTLFQAELSEGSEHSGRALQRQAQSFLSETPNSGNATLGYEAFVFQHEWNKDNIFIYTWLQPQDFDTLTIHSGDPLIQKWVAELDTNELEQRTLLASSTGVSTSAEI